MRSCLVKERREKTEAIKKLVAISLISNSQCSDVKNEGEYFEDDYDPSAGVKNEGVEKFDADAASVKVKREVDSPEQLLSTESSHPSKRRKNNDHSISTIAFTNTYSSVLSDSANSLKGEEKEETKDCTIVVKANIKEGNPKKVAAKTEVKDTLAPKEEMVVNQATEEEVACVKEAGF